MSRRKPLSEQVVVITGASSGIGLTTSRMAAARGARVVLAARSGDALAQVQAEIEAAGGKAIHVVADVGRREDVQAIADRAVAAFGGFDTWVNVAGLTIYGPMRKVSDEDHARLIQTNLWGTVFGSFVAVEHLAKRGGTLINVGSIASDLAIPFQGMYSASKHAVKGFTDALRLELIREAAPVSVTLVKPASIDTPLPNRARNYMDREPTLPPPIYHPDVVAEAILQAAVHPQRDVVIGGGGKVLTALKEISPAASDLVAPLATSLQKRGKPPSDPAGALHAPTKAGQTRGTQPLYALRSSAYTRARQHPLVTTAGAVGFGLAAAAVSLVGASIARRNR